MTASEPVIPAGAGGVAVFTLAGQRLKSVDLAADSLDRTSLLLPRGIYTTLRTYARDRFLRLGYHLARLDESAALLGHQVSVDHVAIRAALRAVLRRTGFAESRIRISVALPDGGQSNQVFIAIEPFLPLPGDVYRYGVKTLTRPLVREAPRAKDTGFIEPSRRAKRDLPPDVHEILLVDAEGRLLEGATSNFFAVLDGVLRTAGAGVLEGVTRSLVLEIAARQLPVHLEPVMLTDLPRLAEAFVTSSTREVVPVVEIDGLPVGNGPGPVARRVLADYRARVLAEAQPA